MPKGRGLVHPKGRWKDREATRRRRTYPVKRVNHLFDYLISDENLGNAIDEVNATPVSYTHLTLPTN